MANRTEAKLRDQVSKLRQDLKEVRVQRDNYYREMQKLKAKLWALGQEA